MTSLRRILLVDVDEFVLLLGAEKSVLLVNAEEEDSSSMTPQLILRVDKDDELLLDAEDFNLLLGG